MSKLDEICATKRQEVAQRKAATSLAQLELRIAGTAQADTASPLPPTPPRGFERALRRAHARGQYGLIAEIKKASPSKGLIRADFQPSDHAAAYQQGGATCLSVLTDAPYFQGHEDYLIAAKQACDLPVLRKDFMVDPWQVAESRAIGADAILIIVAALDDYQMQEIESAALEYEMDVLVEVHNASEMDRAAALKSRLIGINNRDLKSFTTDLEISERLAPIAPENTLLVGESGIHSPADIARLSCAGIGCFLVGESLMRQDDVAAATRHLLSR